MQPIDQTFTSRGFTYAQIERDGMAAIYRQSKPGVSRDSFEAVLLQVAAPITFENGKSYPEREKYPASEQWGIYGFTAQTLARAREIFNRLRARHPST